MGETFQRTSVPALDGAVADRLRSSGLQFLVYGRLSWILADDRRFRACRGHLHIVS